MLFPGFPGVATAVGLFALVWFIIYLQSKGKPVVFDPGGKHGEFGKRLLPMYLDITKFVLGLVAMSIIYGVLFMILLAVNYEHHLHHPNDPGSYTRFKYTRNQSLGFGALLCFCISTSG